MTNGHVDDSDVDGREPSAQPTRSESELSDVNDVPPAPSAPQDENHSDDDAIHDMATSSMDEDEDAPGEEDADYEVASPAPEPANGMRHDRSSSEDDVRSGKRKPEIDDEEYMKQNPELYGLRRSVSASGPASPSHSHSLTRCSQGRARPARRVVRALLFETHPAWR